MIKYLPLLVLIILVACNLGGPNKSHKNAEDRLTEYELVNNWPQLPEGYKLSQPSGLGIDTNGNIFVFHRPGRRWTDIFPDSLISVNPILMLDAQTGKLLNSWGAHLFIMPHGLTVDKNNNVWVTDVGLHEIFKFTHDGKLLMKLGTEKVPGNDSTHFNKPTDVAVTPDGSFYVSDGYGNSRVVKFSATGKYLFEWGKMGNKPAEFNLPHAIDLDARGNVYVADRQNNRVQEFTSTGKFIKEYKSRSIENLYSVTIDKLKNHVITADYMVVNDSIPKGSNITLFDSTGNIETQFGRNGLYKGPMCRYHDLAIGKDGSIYVGDILGNLVQKFVVKKQDTTSHSVE